MATTLMQNVRIFKTVVHDDTHPHGDLFGDCTMCLVVADTVDSNVTPREYRPNILFAGDDNRLWSEFLPAFQNYLDMRVIRVEGSPKSFRKVLTNAFGNSSELTSTVFSRLKLAHATVVAGEVRNADLALGTVIRDPSTGEQRLLLDLNKCAPDSLMAVFNHVIDRPQFFRPGSFTVNHLKAA